MTKKYADPSQLLRGQALRAFGQFAAAEPLPNPPRHQPFGQTLERQAPSSEALGVFFSRRDNGRLTLIPDRDGEFGWYVLRSRS
jgi:hypothetical protein